MKNEKHKEEEMEGIFEKLFGRLELYSLEDHVEAENLKSGIIYLTDEIYASDAATLYKKLDYFQNQFFSQQGTIGGKDNPIKIILCSVGGDAFSGFAIYDKIKFMVDLGMYIVIEGRGVVASLALLIMQSPSHRVVFPNTRFLLHEVSEFSFGEEGVSTKEEKAQELRVINDLLFKLESTRLNISFEEMAKLCKKKDYWFSAEEALKLGFIDEIIGYSVEEEDEAKTE